MVRIFRPAIQQAARPQGSPLAPLLAKLDPVARPGGFPEARFDHFGRSVPML